MTRCREQYGEWPNVKNLEQLLSRDKKAVLKCETHLDSIEHQQQFRNEIRFVPEEKYQFWMLI